MTSSGATVDPARSACRTKRIAISQSNYLPWKGYFDTINTVDEFVLYDDVQYTKRDWRNRNRIKTTHGLQWITVPVEVRGNRTQRIDEARISDDRWADRHWRAVQHAYARAPYFRTYAGALEEYYRTTTRRLLSHINMDLLALVNGMLGIETKLTRSSQYGVTGGRTERLVEICRLAGATECLTGPAAQAYLDEQLFEEAGVEVAYANYEHYPEYPQLHGAFEHRVSIIDLIFNTGPEATSYMKSFTTDG